jgi:putative hemolysin
VTRLIASLAVVLLVAACSSKAPQTANPASINCEERGGQLRFEDQLGVCVFGERQCEQWALYRGECPRGGIPVAGYATSFERYCAIRGGSVQRGTCALPPAGTYVAKLGGGRVATLELDVLGSATLASPGRSTVRGAWAREGAYMTVFSGKERILFRYDVQRLVLQEWDRAAWGNSLDDFRRQ